MTQENLQPNNAQYKRAIMILVDGARPDVLTKEIMKGNLPNIQKYFVTKGTHKTMLTCFPSTTGPAYLPYLTGCFPGTCNIPGVRWFDKIAYAKKGWGFKSFRSYCGLETRYFDTDMNPNIKTAWDIYSHGKNIIGGVTKGIKEENDKTKKKRSLYYYYSHLTDRWAFIDQIASRELVKTIKQKYFDFIFTVFPAVDEYSHRSSCVHERTLKAYHEFDQHLGKAIQELKDQDIYDETLIMIFSDHGLSDTHTHFDVGPWLEKEKKISTLYYTNIFKFRFQASTMVSGNGMCHVYLKGENGWGYRKTFEEISSTSVLLDEFRLRPEVDFVATQGADNSIHIQNDKGHSWFSFNKNTLKLSYFYDNSDPLSLFSTDSNTAEHDFSFDDSLKLTWDSPYPDIFMQLHQLFQTQRTGDIILSARKGFDFRVKFEHPIHKSSHGALLPEHMRVPLLMNHQIQTEHIRSVDLFPTMLKLTGKKIPEGIDGRCLV
jgi:predicted AlkP superfamily pyrophosphatase or phosphodiesterase